jgi:phosphoglycerate dehydrogenase-like enzyme
LANGVRIVSGWAANAVPVAEFTLAQIILANKGFFHATKIFKEQRRDNAHAFSMGFPGSYGCKLGIIGAGMIGRKVIEFIKNCGIMLDILVFDPFLPDEKAKEMGVHKASLEEIFAKCQTISNHLADNAQTKGIFDYKLFNLMLPNAVFINTGRGGQVVETDLARAMKEQPRRAALLDVTEPEPPEKGHVFYELDNIHLSPHIAGAFGNETYRIGQYMLDELERYLAGKPLEYEVNLQMLEVMA